MVSEAFPKKSDVPQYQKHAPTKIRLRLPPALYSLLKDDLHNPIHLLFSADNSAAAFQRVLLQKDLIFGIQDQQDQGATSTSSKFPIDLRAHHLLKLQFLLCSLIIFHKLQPNIFHA